MAIVAPEADPGKLPAVLRGIEAVGKAGASKETLHDIAETAIAVLPRP
ncbi:hypothetical protein VSH64_22875 [Amycolatopsis rhabdoformis]|uniref:TetR family transcriptional regulator n=1 Tax=Amycolatopsis rhabdoformis TaxID=1448059 RepID=A0ABZ1IK96_9PSEU|nr:hypothetical protein [Amycolatopsis rhabdoformis]WSE34887.1 hypothetical protein VSH64_22875 [Amycolatopsis rhabdoformis]